MFKKTFRHGGKIPGYKESTSRSAIQDMPLPAEMVIPLVQHIGTPCEPLVNVGDRVMVGQLISRGQGLSAPIHSSVAGLVTAIDEHPHPGGRDVLSIHIKVEGDQTFHPLPCRVLDSLRSEDLLEAIGNAGIVGMGGAGFPAQVKLSPPPGKPINTVIINGIECEPYLTADHRSLMERSALLIYGLQASMKLLGAETGIVAIEDNKPDAIALYDALLADEQGLSVLPMKTKYPQGGEKQLIAAVLGREVPSGGLPMDVGALVQNVGSVIAIGEALVSGKPLIDRIITVSGPAVGKPGNYRVRLGTPLRHIVECCEISRDEGTVIVMGGPMTGLTQDNLDVPVIKTCGGVLALPGKLTAHKSQNYGVCVNCAKCVEQCPQFLYPNELSMDAEAGNLDALEKKQIVDCIECGLCSYVCPTNRPIVQLIKAYKPKLIARQRERRAGGVVQK